MRQKILIVIQLSYATENAVRSALHQPSSLIHTIQLKRVDDWNLFKFSNSLQLRMELLLAKKKADQLTTDEIDELDSIGDLDRILTHANAMLAAHDSNYLNK
ncbi:hypothetical protein ACQ4N7_03180 [Nodosilinea sp. AN01ver1]|uniref:hypothetical protein n=1 Tax=Nodosilinea sp. AN01ver1 TaxID=3423362 RepID=UPI003D311739